jgi:hypothetical protein
MNIYSYSVPKKCRLNVILLGIFDIEIINFVVRKTE